MALFSLLRDSVFVAAKHGIDFIEASTHVAQDDNTSCAMLLSQGCTG